MRVVLGNRHAVHQVKKIEDGELVDVVEPLKGRRALVIDPADEDSIGDVFSNITHPAGIWATHAKDGAKPAWVASDSPGLAQLLAEHFGGIDVRDLEDPYEGRFSASGAAQSATTLLLAFLSPLLLGLLLLLRAMPWLKTNAGNDFQAQQMGGSASATAVAKWVALTANATAPAAGDTTLTAEITTAGGGLIRKAGTYAHTTGAASYTITTTFTANGSDALPVTIAKRGIFDAASAGNMVFETLVSPTATLSASGDALTLTDTISL